MKGAPFVPDQLKLRALPSTPVKASVVAVMVVTFVAGFGMADTSRATRSSARRAEAELSAWSSVQLQPSTDFERNCPNPMERMARMTTTMMSSMSEKPASPRPRPRS